MVSTHSLPVLSGQYNDIHIWTVQWHSHLVSAMTFTASSHVVSIRSLQVSSGQYTFTASPIWSVQSWSLPVPIWSVHVQWHSPPVPMWSDRGIPSGQYSHGHCSPHLVSTVMVTAVPIWSVQSCSLQSSSGQYSHVHCSPHLVSRMTFTTSSHVVSSMTFTISPHLDSRMTFTTSPHLVRPYGLSEAWLCRCPVCGSGSVHQSISTPDQNLLPVSLFFWHPPATWVAGKRPRVMSFNLLKASHHGQLVRPSVLES